MVECFVEMGQIGQDVSIIEYKPSMHVVFDFASHHSYTHGGTESLCGSWYMGFMPIIISIYYEHMRTITHRDRTPKHAHTHTLKLSPKPAKLIAIKVVFFFCV